MKGLLHGTSSWSEKSWEGVFYPPGLEPGAWLTHYATQFPTVEADVTYYRVPDHRLVSGWNQKTPPGFILSAKFPRSIVHGGEAATPDPATLLRREAVGADLDRFLDAMSLLGPKCGPLVLQFPYFNKSCFATAGPFLDRLDAFLGALPPAFRYGVEIRNRAWLAPPLLELLRRHRVALVLVDLAYMPHPDELELDLVTCDWIYARLIGDRKGIEAKTKTWDRIVVDQSARLKRWAALLKLLMERVPRGFVYANNHYAGHGPGTIRELVGLLERA